MPGYRQLNEKVLNKTLLSAERCVIQALNNVMNAVFVIRLSSLLQLRLPGDGAFGIAIQALAQPYLD